MNLPFPVHFFNIDVGESETLKDDINKAAVDKVAMPFHSEAPTGPVPKPQLGPLFELDNAVVNAFPLPGSKLVSARHYAKSNWGQTAKVTVQLPDGEQEDYFLKTVNLRNNARAMVHGEYESLKSIHAVSPAFAPKPHVWGKYPNADTYFFLTEFRTIGQQPPDPIIFTTRLAEMHKTSVSPAGKFGFHMTTCQAKLPQLTKCWEDSWAVFYRRHLANIIKTDEAKNGECPEFKRLCQLTLNKVVPRLLEPLQSDGRSIKPCLVHGDLWDGNCASDAVTGEPFVFDAGSFYAHNEYELGNWRAVRHRLSGREYVEGYKRVFPPSEPKEEWNDRNLLYSLGFDLVCDVLFEGTNQRQVVKENMTILCEKFFPEELRAL